MGLSIQKRKELAIEEAKKKFPMHVSRYDALDIAHAVLDAYLNIKGRKCKECDNIISSRNKTGLCRTCYMRKYRKKDEQKRLDALRQRYYRRKK
jgi:hypothetical protein